MFGWNKNTRQPTTNHTRPRAQRSQFTNVITIIIILFINCEILCLFLITRDLEIVARDCIGPTTYLLFVVLDHCTTVVYHCACLPACLLIRTE